eukprot:gene7418-20405_t
MAEIHAHNGDDTFMFCTEGGPAVRSVSIEDLASLPSPLLAPVHCKGAFKTLAQLWNPSYILSKVQDGLELDVDRIPACYSCIPDTKAERVAARVEELTIRFGDLLEVAYNNRSNPTPSRSSSDGGGSAEGSAAAAAAAAGSVRVEDQRSLAASNGHHQQQQRQTTVQQRLAAAPQSQPAPNTQPSQPPPPTARSPRSCVKCKFVLDSAEVVDGDPCPICGSVFRGGAAGKDLFPGRLMDRKVATAEQLKEGGFTYYLQQQSLGFSKLFPALNADLQLLAPAGLSARMEAATASVGWLGTGESKPCTTQSQLHKDRKDNVICQATGSKDILLFEPAAEPAMYPREDTDGTHFNNRFSQIQLGSGRDGTVAEVDEAYPLAAAAKGTVVHVAAGDALLIPCGWWHRVDSTADGSVGYHFMVNTFFDMPLSAETAADYSVRSAKHVAITSSITGCSDCNVRSSRTMRSTVSPGVAPKGTMTSHTVCPPGPSTLYPPLEMSRSLLRLAPSPAP